MFPLLYILSDKALLAVRLVLGIVLVAHGFPKLKDIRGTAANFAGMGFAPGIFFALSAVVIEFFGGVALMLGLGVQIVAMLIAVQFFTLVLWKVFGKQALVGGYELDLLILVAALVLMTEGYGVYGLDGLLFR